MHPATGPGTATATSGSADARSQSGPGIPGWRIVGSLSAGAIASCRVIGPRRGRRVATERATAKAGRRATTRTSYFFLLLQHESFVAVRCDGIAFLAVFRRARGVDHERAPALDVGIDAG